MEKTQTLLVKYTTFMDCPKFSKNQCQFIQRVLCNDWRLNIWPVKLTVQLQNLVHCYNKKLSISIFTYIIFILSIFFYIFLLFTIYKTKQIKPSLISNLMSLLKRSSQTKQNYHLSKPIAYYPQSSTLKCKSLSTVKQLVQDIDDFYYKRRNFSLKKHKQPQIDKEEVRKQMKQKWKDPGYCNVEFSNNKALKGKFLNEWEIERICLADRSFKTPKDFKGFKTTIQSREFPKVTKDMYSQKFQKYLTTVQENNQTLLYSPKKKMHTQIPISSNRQRNIRLQPKKIFHAYTTQNRAFGLGTITWKSGLNTKFKTLEN